MRRLAQRTATFEIELTGGGDDLALERAWNDWVSSLRVQGLRPSDEALRSTETSVTYRVFRLDHEELVQALDFDMSRLGALAAAGGIMTFFIGTGLAHYVLGIGPHLGLVA